MKKLLALAMLSSWFALSVPLFAQAESNVKLLCPFANHTYRAVDPSLEGDEKVSAEKYIEEQYKDFEKTFSELYTSATHGTCKEGEDAETCRDSGNVCGEKNLSTGYLEKADCTADNKVITEVSEVVGPEIKANDPSADNRVINVYAGLCCLVQSQDASGNPINCEDVRTIYTRDFDDCTTVTELGKARPGDSGIQNCERRQWVIGSSGAGLLQLVVKQAYTWGVGIVGIIAVVTLILQGIRISVSGVNGDISDAKNSIFQAIAGIVLLFLASLLLYTVNPQFFGFVLPTTAYAAEVTQPTIPVPDFLPTPVVGEEGDATQDYLLNVSIPRAINIGIGLLALAAFIGILIAAIQMLTSFGNEEKNNRAKNNVRYALLGLVIIMMSYAIVSIVVSIALPNESDSISSWLIPKAEAVDVQNDVDILLPSQQEIIENQDDRGRVSLPGGDFLGEVVPAFITNIIYLIGFLIFIVFMYAGTILVSGRGNEEDTTKAKNMILFAAIALALVSFGYALVYGVATLNLDQDEQSTTDDVFNNTDEP